MFHTPRSLWLTCKNRLSALARCCFLGRERWQEKFHEAQRLLDELLQERAEFEARGEQFKQENLQFQSRVCELEAKLPLSLSVKLPVDEPPPRQQYAAGMVEILALVPGESPLPMSTPTSAIFWPCFPWCPKCPGAPEVLRLALPLQSITLGLHAFGGL